MANQRYSESNPNYKAEKEKAMGPGMKNDDGREKGSEYNKVGTDAGTSFKETVNPNDDVKKLPQREGAED